MCGVGRKWRSRGIEWNKYEYKELICEALVKLHLDSKIKNKQTNLTDPLLVEASRSHATHGLIE